MTDSELREVFSKGFANPKHLHELLKRTDLPQNRQENVRRHLSQAYLSGQIQPEALQRFISQLSKAKNLDEFDQVLAELRHANRLIESNVVAKHSLVFTSAKLGQQYHLGATTIEIDPIHEADALYLGTDGRIHLHEVKNTANALRNKLRKHPKQFQNMLDWREDEPDKREIRIIIATEAGWTQIFAARQEKLAVLEILNNHDVGLTIGEYNLTLDQMNELWNATVKKIRTLRKQKAWSGAGQFYRQMPTLLDAEHFLGVSLS